MYSAIGVEIAAKSALTKTAIPGFDYCLNPFIGCTHGCKYCYASFMKRFTRHSEEWGEFLDIRVNLPRILLREVKRKPKGRVIISSVTDPYQLVESKYRLTRRCLEILSQVKWPVSLLTKSPRVIEDIDALKSFDEADVGLTITSDDEAMRILFEPGAPPYAERMRALRELKDAGISTYAFVGPILPIRDSTRFAGDLGGVTDTVLLDRMNYLGKVRGLYRNKKFLEYLDDEYFLMIETVFKKELGEKVDIV